MNMWGRLVPAVAGVGLLAAGCGDDETITIPDPPLVVVDVRDGAWLLTAQWDPCENNPFSQVVLDTLCGFSSETFEDLAGQIPLRCDLELLDDDAFLLSCSGTVPLDACTLEFTLSGSGASTDTTITGSLALISDLIGDPMVCESVASCTTFIDVVAEWLAPAPCPGP